MTIKRRIEHLELAFAGQSEENRVGSQVIIYDPENPPDFKAVMRTRGVTVAVCLPDNGRGDIDPKDIVCGEKTQTSER